MDSVTRQIHQDSLQELKFHMPWESHRMESHTLSQYAYKAANLKRFQCSDLRGTTEENRVALFDMTEKIFSNALTLEVLSLWKTYTSGPVGRSMLQALADSEIASLKTISFKENPEWFRGEGAEETAGVDLLTLALSRQTALEKLNLRRCKLSDTQQDQISQAVPSTTQCKIYFEEEDFEDDEDILAMLLE